MAAEHLFCTDKWIKVNNQFSFTSKIWGAGIWLDKQSPEHDPLWDVDRMMLESPQRKLKKNLQQTSKFN